MMFKQKKKEITGSVLSEKYVPAHLPRYGLGLNTFITSDYRLLSRSFIQEQYDAAEEQLSALIQTSDRFSVGSICDAYIKGQIPHLEAVHREDVAVHELQIHNIRSGLEVRRGVVERRIAQLTQSRTELTRSIEPLKGLNAQFEMKLGRFCFSLGSVVTVAACIFDGMLNYSYISGIVYSNILLLWIMVVMMSVASDVSMSFLAMMLSRKNEDFMDKRLFNVCASGLFGAFLLSVFASVAIRIGSMPETFGTFDASGVFVPKEHYSLADWGLTIPSAFLTTVTGVISFVASMDKNAHLVNRRRKMEEQLAILDAEYEALVAEKDAIDRAADPAIRDLKCRRAAEENLRTLPVGLEQHMRKLLAIHQGEASYTDAMAESAEALLPQPSEEKGTPHTDDIPSINMNNNFKEAV